MKYQLAKASLHYTGKVFWDLVQTIEAEDIKEALGKIHQKGIFTSASIYGDHEGHIGSIYGYKLKEVTK